MADVYFADFQALKPSESVPKKIARLFKAAGLGEIFNKGDLVAVKTHFGEEGNSAYLRAELVSAVVDSIAKKGGNPFLTDCSTLYRGQRTNAVDHLNLAARHGFTYPVVNAPVIIADGLLGTDDVEVEVNLKHFRTIRYGAAAAQASALIAVSHFKGHGLTGFGGALKNVGMGLGSRHGKLQMHHAVKPQVRPELCRGCKSCEEVCLSGAIRVAAGRASIDQELCPGCGKCFLTCPYGAISAGEETGYEELQEKIVEYCYGILQSKKKKAGYVTFVMDVTPLCDCYSFSGAPVVPNLGILASQDIVAIDQAAADLVNNAQCFLPPKVQQKAENHLSALSAANWQRQWEYAETLGLGERDYRLIRLK